MGGYCGVMHLLKAVEGCHCRGWRPLGREGRCRAGEEAAGPPLGRRGIVGEQASWRQPKQVAAGEWASLHVIATNGWPESKWLGRGQERDGWAREQVAGQGERASTRVRVGWDGSSHMKVYWGWDGSRQPHEGVRSLGCGLTRVVG